VRVAVDVGGTFTDVVILEGNGGGVRYEKVESFPQDPAMGVLYGFEKAGSDPAALDFFVHGTTRGINALLTRTGARVAIITTSGFRDVYEIGRTDRDPMYDFKYRKPPLLVPRSRVFEVIERVTHRGEVLVPLNHTSATDVVGRLKLHDVEAVAVCLLHSYANPTHEIQLEQLIRHEYPEIHVTLSHRVIREYREYERMSTAVIDAYVKPLTVTYLEQLERELISRDFRGRFLLARSGGGAMTIASAKKKPVHLVLSGPAGGVVGAASLGEALGYEDLITLDMGGTSVDVSSITDGKPRIETSQHFQTLPLLMPTIDIHTVGAGGGSIAWVDEGGHLQVGPRSAGAVPGPVCYGKGGRQPTFTDAALAVGYLDAENFLGGEIMLDLPLARKALAALGRDIELGLDDTAAGILRLSTAKIVGAVRVISIERGHDPRDFSLIAFGGAGPFIAAEVARELEIPAVIVPPSPATFSAFGMLMADVVSDFSRTMISPLHENTIEALNEAFAGLLADAREALREEGHQEEGWVYEVSTEMRYLGQEHAVSIPLRSLPLKQGEVEGLVEQFGNAHEAHYGHRTDEPVEIVTLRLRAVSSVERPKLPTVPGRDGYSRRGSGERRSVYRSEDGATAAYALHDRALLYAGDVVAGPAIIEESSATTVVHDGDVVRVGSYGELIIRVNEN
jgi:N-methylhydantoinase A